MILTLMSHLENVMRCQPIELQVSWPGEMVGECTMEYWTNSQVEFIGL